MNRLHVVLLAVLVVSALALVHSAYEARRTFAEIEKARVEGARLDADHVRLEAERHGQATNIRVERVARDRLQMVPVNPAITQVVGEGARAAAPSAASAPPAAATGAAR